MDKLFILHAYINIFFHMYYWAEHGKAFARFFLLNIIPFQTEPKLFHFGEFAVAGTAEIPAISLVSSFLSFLALAEKEDMKFIA